MTGVYIVFIGTKTNEITLFAAFKGNIQKIFRLFPVNLLKAVN